MRKHNKPQDVRVLTKPVYGYWQALYLSFFNVSLYLDVLKRWKGLGWKYLALVMVLFSIPLATKVTLGFNRFFDEQVIATFQLLPPLTVQQGSVSLKEPAPYFMKNDFGQVVGVVDPTGQITSLQNRHYPHLSLLITQHEIFYRMPAYQVFRHQNPGRVFEQTFAQKIPSQAYGVVNGDALVKALPFGKLRSLSWIGIYPMLVSLFFTVYAGFFLIIAIFARFISKILLRAPLTYVQTCRLLAVSSTASAACLLFLLSMDWQFAGMGTVLFGMIAVYFSLGGLAYKRDITQLAKA